MSRIPKPLQASHGYVWILLGSLLKYDNIDIN